MRKNEERISAPPEPILNQTSINNLNYVIPTEIVELPSKGKFYPPGHPLHEKDTIEIKHMTAKEEDILTSTSLIQKGVVLDYLLSSLLMDNRIDITTLLSGDKNAIYLNARINGYGPEYQAEMSCGKCGENQTINYNLQDIQHKEPTEGIEYTNGEIAFKLPKLGHTVTIKFLNAKEEISLDTEATKREKLNLPLNPTTTFLKTIITSIEGVANLGGSLYEFIDSLPSMDCKYIKKMYIDNQPDLNFNIDLKCQKCDTEQKGELPITAEFFWPDS